MILAFTLEFTAAESPLPEQNRNENVTWVLRDLKFSAGQWKMANLILLGTEVPQNNCKYVFSQFDHSLSRFNMRDISVTENHGNHLPKRIIRELHSFFLTALKIPGKSFIDSP